MVLCAHACNRRLLSKAYKRLGQLREMKKREAQNTLLVYTEQKQYEFCTELSDTLDQNRIQLQSFAELCAREERVEFLAAGPCRASSDFGMAKTLEATGYTALSPELEEFASLI